MPRSASADAPALSRTIRRSRATKALIILVVLSIALGFARDVNAFGLGLGNRFGKLGAFGQGSGSSPPAGCSGAIDASAGCPLPMLGN